MECCEIDYFSINKISNINTDIVKQEQKNSLKLDEFKNKVLEVIETNKDVGKLKIKALIPNEIRYICKYDKDWIDRIWLSFENIENIKKSSKLDWKERDRVYLRLVREKSKEIYNRIPYQRVTKSVIGTELGIRNMLYNNSDKIPNTISYIQKNQETVEEFRIRRVNNTIKHFIDNYIPLQLWKVAKLSGISTANFMEIKDKLDLPFEVNNIY